MARLDERAESGARAVRTFVISFLVIIVGLAVLWSVNRPEQSLDDAELSTRGGGGSERPVDTTPFEMAGSGEQSVTTLPFRNGTTLPPRVTTTTAPFNAPAEDPICQGAVALGDMSRRSVGFNGDVPRLRAYVGEKMRAAADAFRSAGGNYLAMADLLDQRAGSVESASSSDQLVALVLPVIRLSDPALQPLVAEMTAHLSATCPDLTPE